MKNEFEREIDRLINNIDIQVEDGREQNSPQIVLDILSNTFMGKELDDYFKETKYRNKRALIEAILNSQYNEENSEVECVAICLMDKLEFKSKEELADFFKGMEDLLTENIRKNVEVIDKIDEYKKDMKKHIKVLFGLILISLVAVVASFLKAGDTVEDTAKALAVMTLIWGKITFDAIVRYIKFRIQDEVKKEEMSKESEENQKER